MFEIMLVQPEMESAVIFNQILISPAFIEDWA